MFSALLKSLPLKQRTIRSYCSILFPLLTVTMAVAQGTLEPTRFPVAPDNNILPFSGSINSPSIVTANGYGHSYIEKNSDNTITYRLVGNNGELLRPLTQNTDDVLRWTDGTPIKASCAAITSKNERVYIVVAATADNSSDIAKRIVIFWRDSPEESWNKKVKSGLLDDRYNRIGQLDASAVEVSDGNGNTFKAVVYTWIHNGPTSGQFYVYAEAYNTSKDNFPEGIQDLSSHDVHDAIAVTTIADPNDSKIIRAYVAWEVSIGSEKIESRYIPYDFTKDKLAGSLENTQTVDPVCGNTDDLKMVNDGRNIYLFWVRYTTTQPTSRVSYSYRDNTTGGWSSPSAVYAGTSNETFTAKDRPGAAVHYENSTGVSTVYVFFDEGVLGAQLEYMTISSTNPSAPQGPQIMRAPESFRRCPAEVSANQSGIAFWWNDGNKNLNFRRLNMPLETSINENTWLTDNVTIQGNVSVASGKEVRQYDFSTKNNVTRGSFSPPPNHDQGYYGAYQDHLNYLSFSGTNPRLTVSNRARFIQYKESGVYLHNPPATILIEAGGYGENYGARWQWKPGSTIEVKGADTNRGRYVLVDGTWMHVYGGGKVIMNDFSQLDIHRNASLFLFDSMTSMSASQGALLHLWTYDASKFWISPNICNFGASLTLQGTVNRPVIVTCPDSNHVCSDTNFTGAMIYTGRSLFSYPTVSVDRVQSRDVYWSSNDVSSALFSNSHFLYTPLNCLYPYNSEAFLSFNQNNRNAIASNTIYCRDNLIRFDNSTVDPTQITHVGVSLIDCNNTVKGSIQKTDIVYVERDTIEQCDIAIDMMDADYSYILDNVVNDSRFGIHTVMSNSVLCGNRLNGNRNIPSVTGLLQQNHSAGLTNHNDAHDFGDGAIMDERCSPVYSYNWLHDNNRFGLRSITNSMVWMQDRGGTNPQRGNNHIYNNPIAQIDFGCPGSNGTAMLINGNNRIAGVENCSGSLTTPYFSGTSSITQRPDNNDWNYNCNATYIPNDANNWGNAHSLLKPVVALLPATEAGYNHDSWAGQCGTLVPPCDTCQPGITVPISLNSLYRLARALEGEGEYRQAIDISQRIVEQYPTSTEAQVSLGAIRYNALSLSPRTRIVIVPQLLSWYKTQTAIPQLAVASSFNLAELDRAIGAYPDAQIIYKNLLREKSIRTPEDSVYALSMLHLCEMEIATSTPVMLSDIMTHNASSEFARQKYLLSTYPKDLASMTNLLNNTCTPAPTVTSTDTLSKLTGLPILRASNPNPASTSVMIAYSVSKMMSISLYVLDPVTGAEVARPVNNETKIPGTYSVVLDISLWHRGAYSCILRANDMVLTQTMMVMR